MGGTNGTTSYFQTQVTSRGFVGLNATTSPLSVKVMIHKLTETIRNKLNLIGLKRLPLFRTVTGSSFTVGTTPVLGFNAQCIPYINKAKRCFGDETSAGVSRQYSMLLKMGHFHYIRL